ncbi:hypothetical protein ABTX60_07275 [Streptomyces sp. NPDC126510]|uniref:hypothetical protein n=1 Tax=Streptomyces sp. NPDC126510 TaxID=3155317 RepID=UPI00332BF956
MSGTNAGISLDCPTTLANECWKVPGYRYVSYDNSASTPCGVSAVNGATSTVCDRPNVRVTSWIINGKNVIADPTTDGWDACGVPFLSDLAATLNTWYPFAGRWTVALSDTCAYHVRSRALPPTGTKYGVLTAVDVDTGENITLTPADTVVLDTFYRRITEIDCSGQTTTRWVDNDGATVPAPDPAQLVECTVQVTPDARVTPTQRVRPRIARLSGTNGTANLEDFGSDVQSITLTVLAGAVRVRAVGTGATSSSGPTAYTDDVTVPAGVTLTWAVDGDSYDLALDGSLIFTGTAAGADFLVHWTEHVYTDTD